jgi:hypothetical protein
MGSAGTGADAGVARKEYDLWAHQSMAASRTATMPTGHT